MPFFLDGNPSQGEISEAINYLLGNSQLTTSTNVANGQVTDAVGQVVSYLYKYLYVKYADSFDGTVNFSDTPTNRQYYGLRNNDSATESTNPADYVWYQVSGGFSTNKFIFYSVTGGRRINIAVGLSAPSILYQADSGAAIDLDRISGSDGSSSRICYAKSTSTSLASTPTTYQTSGPSGFPPTNTWGGSETWQATPPTLAVNEALFQSDGIYNPVTDLTTWNVPYLSNLRVGALSAISANLGTITAGDVSIGSSPAISGTTMTGSGSHLYSDGRFITGNSTTNMVFDGSALYLNGIANVSTTVSSVTNLVGAGEVTIASFSVPRTGKTIILWSTNLNTQSVVAAKGINLQAIIRVKNSSNVVVTNSTFEVFAHGSSAYFGSTSNNFFTVPFTYATVVDLTAGSYTLKAYDLNTTAYDAAGSFIAGGVTSLAASGGYTVNIFQIIA